MTMTDVENWTKWYNIGVQRWNKVDTTLSQRLFQRGLNIGKIYNKTSWTSDKYGFANR